MLDADDPLLRGLDVVQQMHVYAVVEELVGLTADDWARDPKGCLARMRLKVEEMGTPALLAMKTDEVASPTPVWPPEKFGGTVHPTRVDLRTMGFSRPVVEAIHKNRPTFEQLQKMDLTQLFQLWADDRGIGTFAPMILAVLRNLQQVTKERV